MSGLAFGRTSLSVLRRQTARRDTIVSLGAAIGGQACILVTGVVSARALGVADRGHFAFIFLIAQVMAILSQLGVPIAIPYYIASSPATAKSLLSGLRRLIVAQVVVVTLLEFVVLLALFHASRTGIQVAAAISISTCGVQVLQAYGLGVLQGLREFWTFNALRLAAPAMYAVFAGTSYLLHARTLLDMTIAYSVAYVVAGLTTFLRSLYSVRRQVSVPVAQPDITKVIRFGLRGLLGASSPIETFKIDQSIVGLFLSSASLGLYVSAVSFTNLPRLLAQSVGMVAVPNVARQPNDRARRRVMWRFTVTAAVVCTLVVGALELLVPFLIPFLFGPAFKAAIPVSRILLIVGLLTSLRRILSDGARGIGKPGLGSIAESLSLVLIVPCLLVAVQLGLLAVGWALCIGAAASLAILLVLISRRNDEAPAPGRRHSERQAADAA